MGIFSKIRDGLKKTRDSFINRLQRIANSFTKIDEELFEQLEEAMIMSDIGVETSEEICDRLRKKIKERGITDPREIMELIQEIIGEIMGDDNGLDLTRTPAVIMVIGVNGAGKTTTIGKLCHQFKGEGKKVLVAAADTFRAAAIDQLEVWTQRAGVDIVKHTEGSDPGAVVYDALEAAKARGCDVVIIDTAGRLHNKKNLMEELAKINRIIDSKSEDCSREILLVLDATTGQNAVSQAKLFSEVADITGIVLTKLDGTAKGGIVISIKNELGIPVKLIGVGEQIEDLQSFDSRTFVNALFDTPVDEDEDAEDAAEETEDTEENGEVSEDMDTPEAADEAFETESDEAAEEESDDEADGETPAAEAEDENVTDMNYAVPEAADMVGGEAESADTENSGEQFMIPPVDWGNDDEELVDFPERVDDGSDDEDGGEAPEEEQKPKKRGFFDRLFGRKDKNDE